jgi:hypothetical protein
MAKKLSDFLTLEKFHEEIEADAIPFKDILDEPIEIYDCSKNISSKNGKFDSYSKLIHFSYYGETEKLNGWVTGEVVLEQLDKLLSQNAIPDLEEGVSARIISYKSDKSEYYKMIDIEEI